MKIAFLSHLDKNLYLFRLPVMQMLIKQGHTVFAITPLGDYTEALEKEGVTVIGYPIERGSLNPLKEIKTLLAIYGSIKKLNLDILHTFMAKPNIYGTFAAKLAHVKVVVNTVTGLGSYFIDESLKSKVVRTLIQNLYKVVFSISNGVIFQNSDDQNYFEDINIVSPKKSFLVRSSGVDTSYFNLKTVNWEQVKKLKNELSLSDKPVVLMVARAIWHKGIAEYIKAASLVKARSAHFILVGGTDEGNPSSASKEWLQEQKSVVWLGERSDIKELMALSSIVVLPSYREGVPRTLLEAASMEKALITTNAPGCKEVVENGKNGFLVPVKDFLLLAEKLQTLIEDEALLKRFSESSREKAVNEFDVSIVVEQYSLIYKNLLKVT